MWRIDRVWRIDIDASRELLEMWTVDEVWTVARDVDS